MTVIDQYLAWRKSERSNASGGCVEVAPLDGTRLTALIAPAPSGE